MHPETMKRDTNEAQCSILLFLEDKHIAEIVNHTEQLTW